MTTTTYREQVHRGMSKLDEQVPGWRDRINLDTLDLGSPGSCVLGQLHGSYIAGLSATFGDLLGGLVYAEGHGFSIVDGRSESRKQKYAELTDVWREELKLAA